MLRLESKTGWWLVTHVDHAHLAGAFAEKWGNDLFLAPEPRERVLRGVTTHDDGWAARDQQPQITRQGKPSAFSVELVGKYSAFEEIDLADYLAVRERAVRMVAEADPYAALLVSMHTYNLLTARADRESLSSAAGLRRTVAAELRRLSATGGSYACTPGAPGGREPGCRRVPRRASFPACTVPLCRVALDL